LPAGKDYRFTAWYKSNVIPKIVAQYIMPDGSEDFFGMPNPEPTSQDWQFYSDTFSVPSGVKAVSVFFFLDQNGWLQTDDYHITPYTYAGFNRGLVTLTFDDGFEENVSTVLPVINQYGFKTTQCYMTQPVEGNATQIANVQKFANAGHEICAHTVTHPFLTQLGATNVDYELQHSRDFLRSITGQAVDDFASPYGDYNAAVITEIKKFFTSHRTTDEGYNSKDNLNPYRLRVQNMTPTTTLAQYQEWVNKAKADHTWLILVYHKVATTNLDAFDTNKADFDQQMAWLSTSGITVESWHDALAETSSQL
jgi:peptidoglycan/xylan/chitin deacetylase (PgdA/CDA1 family)